MSKTAGKISFIPIYFLREYVKEKYDKKFNFNNEEEGKLLLVYFHIKKQKIHVNFFNKKYKNIPLI